MKLDTDTPGATGSGLWRYPGSKLALRGPKHDLNQPFVAILGGSETFGKFVKHPYPALLQEWIRVPVLNLGVMHAGVSLFSKEQWLLDIASRARLTVIQVMGAQNMSNRLYCVHPRRNDRFLTGSDALRTLYPEVDFADVNFTGHLMASLAEQSGERFAKVLEELQWAWVQRMRRVIKLIRSDVVLLWLSERSPDESFDQDPMFVTRAMLDELKPLIRGVAEVVRPSPASAGPEVPFACAKGDAPLHAEVAEVLAGKLAPYLDDMKKGPTLVGGTPETEPLTAVQSFSISSGTAVKRSATRP